MKNISLGILCLSLSFTSFADHLQGGEIRYEHDSGNNYKVYLDVYTSCGNLAVPTDSEYVSIDGPASYSTYTRLPKTRTDTIAPYCPGTSTSCSNLTGGYPATVSSHYEGIITLPATTGVYKFSYASFGLTFSNNISGFSGLYLEAMVDNSSGGNSSAYIANKVGGFIGLSDTSVVPYYAVDPEKDSIAYDIIAPQVMAGVNATFVPGFTLTSPFGMGSLFYIQNSSLHMKGTTLGNSFICVRTKDYRSGNLVGYTTRQMLIPVIPATPPTIPLKSSSTSLTSTTCAGNSNSLTFTFDDPTATDSVFININPPAISGFTFSTTSTPGIGSGSATVSWTTPLSVTPSALPYFYIHANVRDNECDPRGEVKFAHIVYVGSCPVDSVWPGDANSDNIVNLLDPLYIALAFGQTGPSRPAASTAWVGQYCAPWGTSLPGGINSKHADCDGNGTVGLTDLVPVLTNFGLTHPKNSNEPHSKTTGLPDLYFDFTGVEMVPGATVTLPLMLGNTSTPMADVYGIAARIKVEGITLSAPPVFNYANSWLGNSTNTLTFNKNINSSVTDWVYARTDHENNTGQGTLATVTFTIPANAQIGSKVTLAISDEKMINKYGDPITAFNVIDNSAMVQFATSVSNISQDMLAAHVMPNPSIGDATLQINTSNNSNISVKIVDIVGRVVWNTEHVGSKQQAIHLPAEIAKAGIYFVQVSNGIQSETIKWIKQ